MTLRLVTVVFSALIAVFATTGAQARVEKQSDVSITRNTNGSITRANMGSNFKARTTVQYAYSKSGKRYASGSHGPSRRVASSHNHGGGGTSRACLTSEARALLGRIEARFGSVEIVSTCRPGAVIAGSGKPSKHRYGQAIDFNAGGRKGAIVSWLIANHHSGGTMTYAGMSHIHVDVGYHFVSLNSASGR